MHAPNVENHELWKPATCIPRGKGEHQHVINFNNLWNIWRRKFFRGESKSVDPLLFRVTQPWYVVPMQSLSHIHTLTHSGGHHVPVSVEALSALKLLKLNARYHTYLKPLKLKKFNFWNLKEKTGTVRTQACRTTRWLSRPSTSASTTGELYPFTFVWLSRRVCCFSPQQSQFCSLVYMTNCVCVWSIQSN